MEQILETMEDIKRNINQVKLIIKDVVLIGAICVLLVYLIALILENLGAFSMITNGIKVDQTLMFCGLVYFLARVFRDVAIVVLSSLNKKYLLYKIYLIEIFTAFSLMYLTAPSYGSIGIFLSMMMGCIFGLLFNILHYKRSFFESITD